jgi:hypothetical protein
VDSSGTLAEDEWANELHPTPEGFDRIVRERWIPVVAPLLGVAVPKAATAKAKLIKKQKARKKPRKTGKKKAAKGAKKHA